MKDKDLLKLLKDNGWKLDRICGSHHIMIKDNKTEVIPVHNKECADRLTQYNFKANRAEIALFVV